MRIIRFDQRDVVRHRLVQAIVNAYEIWEASRPEPETNGNGKKNGQAD
jgi:phosphate starvation-inducible protein PhoH